MGPPRSGMGQTRSFGDVGSMSGLPESGGITLVYRSRSACTVSLSSSLTSLFPQMMMSEMGSQIDDVTVSIESTCQRLPSSSLIKRPSSSTASIQCPSSHLPCAVLNDGNIAIPAATSSVLTNDADIFIASPLSPYKLVLCGSDSRS